MFQGRNSIDLSPKVKLNRRQSIVLFGGLNGAGKSTILVAIQLALYGRHSLGFGTSQKEYHAYLKNSVHRSHNSICQVSSAAIELTFSYSHMGVLSQFKVARKWSVSKNNVTESLDLHQDDEIISNLSYDQCQSFLNELIPIGVSNLFFFDGEKIKELADDNSGTRLADSVRKLHGLDIIERLDADLLVFLRNQNLSNFTNNAKKEIECLENQLTIFEDESEAENSAYEQSRIEYIHLNSELDRLKNEINLKGGAWAISREEEIKNQALLVAEKTATEEKIREILSGYYPLSLANRISSAVLDQLSVESNFKRAMLTIDGVGKHLENLKSTLNKSLKGVARNTAIATIDSEIRKLTHSFESLTPLHDITDSHYARIQAVLNCSLDYHKQQLKSRNDYLKSLNLKIESAGINLNRAPDAETLIKDFQEISMKQIEVSKQEIKMKLHKENAKRHLKNSINTTRKLQTLFKEISRISDANRAIIYAENTRTILRCFSNAMVATKVKDIESEFSHFFRLLANKDRANLKATIDSKTFRVNLIDKDGQTVNKDELSAGEKQICAISVLAALARTSRRKLPIIIDTPLGRLDSTHRQNLIKNYFPYASHQVLILSTDTEVDKQLYSELYQYTSHAFKLVYDADSNSSIAEEGYFWKQD